MTFATKSSGNIQCSRPVLRRCSAVNKVTPFYGIDLFEEDDNYVYEKTNVLKKSHTWTFKEKKNKCKEYDPCL